jgi:7-cyano-7-deazaguanine synthase
MKALLFSGGIESTCLAYSQRPDICLTIDYGQVAAPGELTASRSIAKALKLNHEVMEANVREFGFGLLAGQRVAIPKQPEFWPFRNQLLITLAAMRLYKAAEVHLIIGTVRSDQKHADGTSNFLSSMTLGTQKYDLVLEYPASRLSTEALIRNTKTPDNILGYTFSCHTGPLPCGRCPGCIKNLRAREFSLSSFRTSDHPTKQAQAMKPRSSSHRRGRASPGNAEWQVRPVSDLNRDLTRCYGVPIQFNGKISGLCVICKALNRNDLLHAQNCNAASANSRSTSNS